MLSHFVTVVLTVLPLAQCIQIHKYMTEEEVLKTFQTDHNNVPEYEVVRLYHTLHKRDIDGDSTRMVKLNVFGRELSLYLEPTQGLLAGVSTPVWTVIKQLQRWPVRPHYFHHPNIIARIGQAYQDVSKRSAIVAYDGEDGETLVQGELQDDLTVIPLPYHLHKTVLRETRDLVEFLPDGVDGEEDFRRSHYHVVFKRGQRDMNGTHDGVRVMKQERRSSEATPNDPSKRNIPDIVYPEILVIVDSVVYKALGRKLLKAVRYVLAFWNAVDLRYRLLEEPIIRLNIAGIIISLEPRGTPYLAPYLRSSMELHTHVTLQTMGRYFYEESSSFPFATYDIAMAMTGLDLCTVKSKGSCSTIGTTHWKGACNRNHTTMKTKAVGIVEDNGGYKGILSAAHEVAHLMGAGHDGNKATIDCPAVDGYLMAPRVKYAENRFHWSNCSLQYLYDFLSAPESACLRNEPRAGQAIPRLLPGQLLTLDEQCEKFHATKACYHDARVCTGLQCYEPGSSTDCVIRSVAAEGSSCGNNLHCINGYCVSKNMRYVPYEKQIKMKIT